MSRRAPATGSGTRRHRFLPDRTWLRDGAGGYQPVDRATEPDGWWAAAYSDRDQPLVTRFTDNLPSSSASRVSGRTRRAPWTSTWCGYGPPRAHRRRERPGAPQAKPRTR